MDGLIHFIHLIASQRTGALQSASNAQQYGQETVRKRNNKQNVTQKRQFEILTNTILYSSSINFTIL
jgi:hypothetical protein